MSFVKIGENFEINSNDIKTTDSVLSELDSSVLDQFIRTASDLKKIAPKAKDFLYFTGIMLHAAEAALYDDEGNIKKDAKGQDVSAKWEVNEKTGSWKWVCSDKSIKPMKNNNGDIFPEPELKIAYKKWVGKPLCIDHKSSSVDHIRGVIVDTFYDDKLKRVIGLCALDKVNYPDLARKVSTGYSANLSMGTGVSCAICYDCGKAARVEADFCNHMRSKSCYGEINTGLSPIELSIVVNPADPKARIRHIVAAADSIAKYVEQKELSLKTSLSSNDFDKLEKDLENAQDSLNKLKEGLSDFKKEELDEEKDEESDKNDAGVKNMAETDIENTDRNYNMPARFAEENDLNSLNYKLIFGKLNGLEEKINNFINKMASIEKTNNFSEETDMANEKKAYFQGGGEGNEPAPKAVKYPKEDSDKIREKEDKQMSPEPSSMGADGLHPGDEAKKKLLLRASELEARALRRKEAVEKVKSVLKSKEAYFNGGGEGNEPTPGKAKYPKEDSDKTREKEDKQMVGAPPFPSVGKIDGLYGDDLKKKEMLSRATLNARFIKAANADGSDNIGNSGWHVFSKTENGEKLILTATVSDIAGDKAEAFYDSIATKAFGSKIINTIKTQGFEKAVKMYKGAQEVHVNPLHLDGLTSGAQPSKEEVDAAEDYRILHNGEYPADFVKKYPTYRAGMKATAQAAPIMPASAPGAAVDSNMPSEVPAKAEDKGADGNPADQIAAQIEEIDNITADMKKAVESLEDENTNDLGGLPASSASSVSLPDMRKTLNSALKKGFKQAVSELQDNKEELELIVNVQKNSSASKENSQLVKTIVSAALNDAKTSTANAYKLMSAFVKYAHGTDALLKKAAEEAKMKKSAQEANDPHDWKQTMEDLKKVNPPPTPEEKFPLKVDPKPVPPGTLQPIFESGNVEDSNDAVSFEIGDDGKVKGTADSLADVKAGAEYDLNTPEGRAVMRAKIAQKGLKFSDMIGKAHPKGGTVVPGLNSKPTGDLAKVEDIEEAHDKIMDIVSTVTPKVRTAAEQIQKLVVAGKIDPAKDFDGLIAEGLDSAAVSFWKKFYGEAKDGGSQFAADLVKNYETKKSAELESAVTVKVSRAFELAHEMAERGMIANNAGAIRAQADEIVKYNDASFDSLKKVVARQGSMAKTASHLPVVGYQHESIIDAAGLTLPGAGSGSDLRSQLEAAFNTPVRPGKR